MTRRNLAGDVLASAALSIPVAAGAAVTVPLPPDLTTPTDPAARADRRRRRRDPHGLWFFARDKDIAVAGRRASPPRSRPTDRPPGHRHGARRSCASLTLYPGPPRPGRRGRPGRRHAAAGRVGHLHRPLRIGRWTRPPSPPARCCAASTTSEPRAYRGGPAAGQPHADLTRRLRSANRRSPDSRRAGCRGRGVRR